MPVHWQIGNLKSICLGVRLRAAQASRLLRQPPQGLQLSRLALSCNPCLQVRLHLGRIFKHICVDRYVGMVGPCTRYHLMHGAAYAMVLGIVDCSIHITWMPSHP